MRTVAVFGLEPLEPGTELRVKHLLDWREPPEVGDAVDLWVTNINERQPGTVVAVDAAARTYTVAVGLPLFAGLETGQ